jgi:hypothetical protein
VKHHIEKLNPASSGQSGGGGIGSSVWDSGCKQQRNLPNQWRRTGPRPVSVSLQCKLSWDGYRLEKLPPDDPRRRPTLVRLSFLDEEGLCANAVVIFSEARAAIIAAKAKLPTLTVSGIGVGVDDAFDQNQIETAIAFLRRCRATAKPTLGSCGLKHSAERWGRRNGLSPYVSNGSLICAAIFLGFPISEPIKGNPNVSIGVHARDVVRLSVDPSTSRRRRAS